MGAIKLDADSMDDTISQLDVLFTDVCRGILASKREDASQICSSRIENLRVKVPLPLVRGIYPYGPQQYKACKSSAVTDDFMRSSAADLSAALLPIAEEFIVHHSVTATWADLLEKYNAANAKLVESDVSKALVQDPIELDLSRYIVEQTVQQLGELMRT